MAATYTDEIVVAGTEGDDTPQELRDVAKRIAAMVADAKPVRVDVVPREGRGHFSFSVSPDDE